MKFCQFSQQAKPGDLRTTGLKVPILNGLLVP